ncbi:MAG: gas vesicle protein GvpN [Desulforudis sp.]|jgi:gas vesicle protein GvpN|nr:MAG: gas vesicle protein GvpN [Desulforudis sp.]
MTNTVIFELSPDRLASMVTTPYLEDIRRRALAYLNAGYPVHFSGPSGVGKTTMAFILAAAIGRPVVLINGNDEFFPSDLIGGNFGFKRRLLIDNFIHSVLKKEEEVQAIWFEGRMTTACRMGYTLIYDEFNRSRPETNNVLLSILGEGVVNLQGVHNDGKYLKVHPEFRVIFTSNPAEYIGVHRTQDALIERMITVDLGELDRSTEIEITMCKSGAAESKATTIVDMIRALRTESNLKLNPTVRAAIRLATLTEQLEIPLEIKNPLLKDICRDVLNAELIALRNSDRMHAKALEILGNVMEQFFAGEGRTLEG